MVNFDFLTKLLVNLFVLDEELFEVPLEFVLDTTS